MNLKHIILMLAAGLFTACAQDEFTDGTRLPEGKYPLELTVNLGTATRATVDNTWDANTTVYVQIV